MSSKLVLPIYKGFLKDYKLKLSKTLILFDQSMTNKNKRTAYNKITDNRSQLLQRLNYEFIKNS